MSDRDCVAIINTSPDTVDLLKDALQRAGFVVVSALTWEVAQGDVNLASFLAMSRPKVIVYDLAPPYDKNFAFLQHLRSTLLQGYQFVLTSPNPARVEKLVGRDNHVYEVVGREEDLAAIVRATKEAARARAVS